MKYFIGIGFIANCIAKLLKTRFPITGKTCFVNSEKRDSETRTIIKESNIIFSNITGLTQANT